MNPIEILLAKKFFGNDDGGGGGAVLINKDITANGTYNASSDNADGYKKVVVNVSGGGSADLSDLNIYIGDYTNDPVTLTLGSVDKYYRRIYGQ